MADLIWSVLLNPLILAAVAAGAIALAAWWFWPKSGGRARSKRDGYTRYFNDEFKDSVIPSRARIKSEVIQLFDRMNAELPEWKTHSDLGAWHVEHSLGGQLDSDALRASIIYGVFFDAPGYQRLPKRMPFSYGTMRSLIAEAIFLYRREFDVVELGHAIVERQARDQARRETEGTAWSSR